MPTPAFLPAVVVVPIPTECLLIIVVPLMVSKFPPDVIRNLSVLLVAILMSVFSLL